MEHTNRPWRRKSSENMLVANARSSLSLESSFINEDQDKVVGLTRGSSYVTDKLALNSITCDCAAKEELIRKHAKMAELAFAGQQMAESEAAYLKQELEKALQQGEVAEQRLAQLDAALKDCMSEIEVLGAEQEGRIQHAFSKATEDFKKLQKKLEGKLAESNKRISNLSTENSNLMKALLCKEKLIEDIDRDKAQLESEFEMLVARLDLMEKENTLLKYECGVIEEELRLRNEERGQSCRSALDSAKMINRLEAECHELQNQVRKRLQSKRNSLDETNKENSLLIERIYDLEEENKDLKEIVSLGDSEIRSWRIKCGQMDARLVELEDQLRELSQGDRCKQLVVSDLFEEMEGFGRGNDFYEGNKFAIVKTKNEPKKCDSWLDEILNMIMEEQRVSQRSFSDILQDIKIVVGCNDDVISKQKEETHSNISGLLHWKGSNSNSMDDASFAREKVGKHLSLERSRSENQIDVGSNNHNTLAQMIKIQSSLQDENRRTKEKLQLVNEENLALKKKLQESNERVESLKREMEITRENKGLIEEQLENLRLINEDLDTQLAVARAKLNQLNHKVSSLEFELEDKNNCCEEMETTCLELQLQLEILSRTDTPKFNIDPQVAKKLKTEMIQNLGKQLSILNSPDTILVDNVVCPTTNMITNSTRKSLEVTPQRPSLRDRMLAEDKDVTENSNFSKNQHHEYNDYIKALPPGSKVEQAGSMAIVPSKKPSGGFGFITKLFLRRKKGYNKMKHVSLQRNTSGLVGPRDVLLVAN